MCVCDVGGTSTAGLHLGLSSEGVSVDEPLLHCSAQMSDFLALGLQSAIGIKLERSKVINIIINFSQSLDYCLNSNVTLSW